MTTSNDWIFKTPNFEIQLTKTPYLQFVTIMRRPVNPEDWPIGVAVDVGNNRTRQQLVLQALSDHNERIIRQFLQPLIRIHHP